MSVEHVSDEMLQRHFDGELEPAEQAQAHEHLGGCASATRGCARSSACSN